MPLDVGDHIDRLTIEGHTIGEDHDDDPVLMDPAGAVDTWRERYPYDERMPREECDELKYPRAEDAISGDRRGWGVVARLTR